MFDKKLWGLKVIKSFHPYCSVTFNNRIKYHNIIVKKGEYLRIHDKADDLNMWEVSYNDGRLRWTDIDILKECCVSVNCKDFK